MQKLTWLGRPGPLTDAGPLAVTPLTPPLGVPGQNHNRKGYESATNIVTKTQLIFQLKPVRV
jgi:hypothetical protein